MIMTMMTDDDDNETNDCPPRSPTSLVMARLKCAVFFWQSDGFKEDGDDYTEPLLSQQC